MLSYESIIGDYHNKKTIRNSTKDGRNGYEMSWLYGKISVRRW